MSYQQHPYQSPQQPPSVSPPQFGYTVEVSPNTTDLPPRPSAVVFAMALLAVLPVAGLGFTLLMQLATDQPIDQRSLLIGLVYLVGAIGMVIFVDFMLWRGSSEARILALCLVVVGLFQESIFSDFNAQNLQLLFDGGHGGYLVGIALIGLAQLALVIGTFTLLFRRDVSAWMTIRARLRFEKKLRRRHGWL